MKVEEKVASYSVLNPTALMSEWTETTFGDLAEYVTSGSRDWSKYYSDQGALFIRTQDINTNQLRLDGIARVALPEKVEGKRTRVYKGDILITITGANVGKVAFVDQDLEEAYVSQSVALVRLRDKRFGKFLHLQLTTKFLADKTHLEAMAYGLGRPVLNLDNIRNVLIRLVPFDNQTRIVAEIEKQFSRIDEAVTNLKRVKANIKRYKAAVLKAAVEGRLVETEAELARKKTPSPRAGRGGLGPEGGGEGAGFETGAQLLQRILETRRSQWQGKGKYKEPVAPDTTDLPELPEGWVWATVGQLGAIKGGKRLPAGHVYAEEKTPHPYIRVTDFENFGVRTSELQYLKEETQREIARYTISSEDVYISIAGTIGLVGQVPEQISGANLTENAAKITGLIYVDPMYLVYWLSSSKGIGHISDSTIATTQAKLALFRIEKIPVPYPPLSEQHRIVAEIDRHLSLANEAEAQVNANLQRAERLRQSILARAFSGDCDRITD